jgi:H+/gluconate symporter-like permease
VELKPVFLILLSFPVLHPIWYESAVLVVLALLVFPVLSSISKKDKIPIKKLPVSMAFALSIVGWAQRTVVPPCDGPYSDYLIVV